MAAAQWEVMRVLAAQLLPAGGAPDPQAAYSCAGALAHIQGLGPAPLALDPQAQALLATAIRHLPQVSSRPCRRILWPLWHPLGSGSSVSRPRHGVSKAKLALVVSEAEAGLQPLEPGDSVHIVVCVA